MSQRSDHDPTEPVTEETVRAIISRNALPDLHSTHTAGWPNVVILGKLV